MKKNYKLSLTACAVIGAILLHSTTSAAVTAITQTGSSTYVLDTITIDGSTYSQGDITLGQLDAVLPASGAFIGEVSGFTPGAGGASTPADAKSNLDAASSSFTFGTSGLNIAAGSVFQFGQTISDSDVIFLLEFAPSEADTQTLELVDSNNDVIGSYTTTFVGADFTDNLTALTGGITFRTVANVSGSASSVNSLGGLSISLSDFGVTAGAVSNATGIRYQNSALYDTAMVGLISIPEPQSYALLLGGLSAIMIASLRRRRQ